MAGGRVDGSVLTQLAVDLGADHAAEICRLFLESATREVQTVGTALDVGDTAGAARSAHRLKSASGFVGATGLATLCAEVEAGAPTPALRHLLVDELEQTAVELDLTVRRFAH